MTDLILLITCLYFGYWSCVVAEIQKRKAQTSEEQVMNGNKPGTKHDAGKPILGAIPPAAELAVGRVLAFGAKKYARENWHLVDDAQTLYMDAALRHLNALRRGEVLDSESGEHHLAHVACCVLFMLELSLRETDLSPSEEYTPFTDDHGAPVFAKDIKFE